MSRIYMPQNPARRSAAGGGVIIEVAIENPLAPQGVCNNATPSMLPFSKPASR